MATVEVTYLECDLCGRTDNPEIPVETHTMVVDGHAVEFEACQSCWDKRVLKTLGPLSAKGRKPKRRTTRRKVVPWPGTPWLFTSHALQRLGERHITPLEAVSVVEDPATTRPGREPNATVFWRDHLQVVADPHERTIFTAALRDA